MLKKSTFPPLLAACLRQLDAEAEQERDDDGNDAGDKKADAAGGLFSKTKEAFEKSQVCMCVIMRVHTCVCVHGIHTLDACVAVYTHDGGVCCGRPTLARKAPSRWYLDSLTRCSALPRSILGCTLSCGIVRQW